MDFTAIDFETATRRSDSACQLAAVRVRDGQIVDSKMWMIRPRPLVFSPGNIRVHGITPGQVADEPEFGELWDDIRQTLGDDVIIAHNAAFDLGVLIGCLTTHRREIPTMQYSCTRAIARAAWPDRPRYGLKPLSDWLGVQFRHHDALEDSVACAKIALAAAVDHDAATLPELETKLQLSRGSAGPRGRRGPSRGGRRRSFYARPQTTDVVRESSPVPAIDWQRVMIRLDFIRPLAGKRIVIDGPLRHLSGDIATELVTRGGGCVAAMIDSATDLWITRDGGTAVGETAAVSEDQFLSMIGAA